MGPALKGLVDKLFDGGLRRVDNAGVVPELKEMWYNYFCLKSVTHDLRCLQKFGLKGRCRVI